MEGVSRRGILVASALGAAAQGAVPTAAQMPAAAASPEADMASLQDLIQAARTGGTHLGEQLLRHLPGLELGGAAAVPVVGVAPTPDTSTIATVASGNVAAVWGQDFLFAVKSEKPASIAIDRQPQVPMTRVGGTDYWYRLETLRLGVTHTFTLYADGRDVGTNSVAGYNPDSYPLPGVAAGMLSAKRSIVSSIYGGAVADYWIYANAGIDTVRGAPLMVWQDGQNHVGARDLINYRLRTVTDNLVHKKLIPPMAHLLIAPGTGGEPLAPRFPGEPQNNAMRSLQYDTVSDRYGEYLRREVLPEVEKQVKLRQDSYSRGAAGASSGAICAFNLAWFHPDRFSRVHSNIGSFTGLQWFPEQHIDGGYIVSNNVRREPRHNIRVWMSDGMYDLEVDSSGRPDIYIAGSWALNNIQLANALKTNGYDFHFRFGVATHSSAQGAMDLPESLAWLWRGYDPDKTAETFDQEATERAKPIFRVQIANRSAW